MRHSFVKIHNFKRGLSVPVVLALAISLIVVTSFAYLIVSGGLANKTEIAPEYSPTIVENPVGSYYVDTTTTEYSMYVRVAVSVYWLSDSNSIYAHAPVEGQDYSIAFNTTDWFYEDGFYYYKIPATPQGTVLNKTSGKTTVLVSDFATLPTANVPTDAGGDEYSLKLTMVAQTIQAKGTTDVGNIPAVEDAWKSVTIDGSGNLIPKP